MVFYRFLFAPVLLVVAVLIGARDRAAAPPSAPPQPQPQSQSQARAAATSAGAPLAPARGRTGRTHPAALR
jgi:hypothetical protein